jgi:SAM-dependent methyltransferase
MANMSSKDFRGLRFPDDYIIKFFFKTNCHQKSGNVLELGCGNGNNLRLFYDFGWDVCGIDKNRNALEDAYFNFKTGPHSSANREFREQDLSRGIGIAVKGKFDVILLPSVLNYLERKHVESLMEELKFLLAPETLIFCRTRTMKDYRYGRGSKIGRNAFQLSIEETSEYNLVNVFYDDYEIVDLFRHHLSFDISTMTLLHIDFQNLQGDVVVSNSDLIIWGKAFR